MQFLRHLHTIKLSELALLDLAYVVVLLPLVVMLKTPMLLFSIIALGLILFKRQPANNTTLFSLFILGITALYLSLYGAFSFSGLSRLKLFLELLVYILIIVVSLQRLTRKINFYLLISPFLFLALSLFFYHGILMLNYVIFEVFVLLWMILSHRMQGDIKEGFKTSMIMFMHSLPWVVLLFIFFPRISFEHADYGFKGEVTKRMGHDGTMYLDGNALLVPSDRIVMEIGFEGKVPPDSQLYFRGSILYVDKKDHWEGLPPYSKRESLDHYPTEGMQTAYKVTLYPTQKKWLYMLDMPARAVDESTLDRDLISTIKEKIDEPIHYAAHSLLSNRYAQTLDTLTYKASTEYNSTQNPQTFQEAQKLKASIKETSKRAKAVLDFFKSQSLTYTLKPDALDTDHTTDSFLFDKRRGYCVHFTSSFVTMSRMAGIPARVVTGYKGESAESLNNYLAIKEKNAHAWAELYINKAWVRYETTTTASNIDIPSELSTSNSEDQKKQNPLLKKINLYLMYTKYQIETWILYYSHIRQLQLLDYAKKNPLFILIFMMTLMVLVLITFIIIGYLKRPQYTHKALAMMQPLLQKLHKEKHYKKEEETLHQYLLRYQAKYPKKPFINEIDRHYEEMVYGGKNSKSDYKALKELIKKFIQDKNG
ncbi:MAG: DUF3488 and transglutaminase-like domain-containing protein [Campylobacterota bacterium]|nr:DUF3488 and transglutaminase-like domain-containing protein [Campylobacterota bacterium]